MFLVVCQFIFQYEKFISRKLSSYAVYNYSVVISLDFICLDVHSELMLYAILQINLAEETIKGLLAHWLTKRKQKSGSQALANGEIPSGKDIPIRNHSHSRVDLDDKTDSHSSVVHPAFEFSTVSPPSIITEGSHGGPWRKKITDLDGTEDDKEIPWWCMDCILNKKIPHKDNTK